MSELILAYGIGVVSTLIFILIGCVLENIETRKLEAENRKNDRTAFRKVDGEREKWQKRRVI